MAVIRFRNPNSVFPDDNDEYDEYDEEDREDDGQDFIDEDIELSEQAKKRRRQILRLLLRGLIVAGVAAAFVVLVTWLAGQRVYSSASYQVVANLTATDDTHFLPLGNRIVYYSNDGATCLGRNGNTVWSISYEMQNPLTSTAGDMLAIGDYNGSTIYLQNADGTVGSVNTSLPIRDLSVSESGEVAAVLSDTDTTWVYLYNSAGDTIAYFKTTMEQSGYPISVSVSPNGEMVCVSHLITGSSGIQSSIAFYNFGNVGQNVAENNVSGFNYSDEVFPFTKYLTDSSCVAVSDARIAYFSGKEIPQNGANAMFTGELQGVYASDNYIGLLFPDSTGAGLYSLQIYDTTGNLISTIPFTQDYTDIQIAGKCVYISNESSMSIYTIQGQQRYSGSFPAKVSAVIPESNSSSQLFIMTENGLEEMTLQ